VPQDLHRQEQGLYSQADKVKKWAEQFRKAVSLPVILWDETMSSHDAQALAQQLHRKPGQPIDDLAARMILQSYLDALQDGSVEFPG
jgi:RNase H-fold protein (predicted Holliday junction resolvase)